MANIPQRWKVQEKSIFPDSFLTSMYQLGNARLDEPFDAEPARYQNGKSPSIEITEEQYWKIKRPIIHKNIPARMNLTKLKFL